MFMFLRGITTLICLEIMHDLSALVSSGARFSKRRTAKGPFLDGGYLLLLLYYEYANCRNTGSRSREILLRLIMSFL